MQKKQTTYNDKYYQKQDHPTYVLDVDKIIREFNTYSEFAKEMGLSRAIVHMYVTGKVNITEKTKHFETIKDYIKPDGLSTQKKEKTISEDNMEFKSMIYNQPGIDNPEHDFKLKYKNKTMGASSVATLLGFSPFSTPEELCNTYALEIGNTFKANTAIDLGNELEDYILRKAQTLIPEKYPQLFGQDHSWVDGKGAEYRSTKFEHLTCNFDAILSFDETGVIVPVEAKRSDAYIVGGDFYSVNNYLYTQLQIQMFMLDSPFGFGIQLSTKNNTFKIEMVPRDQDFITKAIGRIATFFNSNYNVNEEYAWFTEEKLETLFDEKLERLDEAIALESKLKSELSDATQEVDAILAEIGEKEFKSKYYSKTYKVKKLTSIKNPNKLYSILKDDETIECEVKVPAKNLKKMYPLLYDEYIEEHEIKELNGRRNTRGITK